MNHSLAPSQEQAASILARVFDTWAALRAHLSPPTSAELVAAIQSVPASIKAGLAQEIVHTDAALYAVGLVVNAHPTPELQRAVFAAFASMLDSIQGQALQPLLCKATAMFADAAATQGSLLKKYFERAKDLANTILADLLSAGMALES